jgi:SAM-dependent methyltransferase
MALLADPRFIGVEPGTPRFFALQRRIIAERPLLRESYDLWYRLLLEDERSVASDRAGLLVELGSGGGYFKDLCPSVVSTDVGEGVAEHVVDGRELPFTDASVRALFMTHVFHHIPNVEAFLDEAARVLVPGGVIAMIEVPHTPFARVFFRRFHPEPYDDRAPAWGFEQSHSMLDANQALSWNVFFRDRARFEQRFPQLVLERADFLPWLGYLLSGGVTRRNLIPPLLVPILRRSHRWLRPTEQWMAVHWHLRVRKGG